MRSFLLWNLFAFVVLATATVACGDLAKQPANPESEESSFTVDEYTSSSQFFSEFMSELQAGASCEELFAWRLFAKRNSADLSDPIIDQLTKDQMNIELSFIGCYGSSSERRDLAEQPANPESEESSFTVDEYRLYRSVIDTPLSVPEDQAMQNAAEEYGVTIQDANLIAEKVLLVLLTNSWFGRPEAEIRRASDWQGETK